MARVLVTGAGGFVGANLVRALVVRGDDVHACVRPGGNIWRLADVKEEIALHDLDMTDVAMIEKTVAVTKPKIVYHLAHYGGNRGQDDAAMVQRVIVQGSRALFEACERFGVARIVNAGSSSEYGAQREAMREDMIADPQTPYGKAKLKVTNYSEEFSQRTGIHVTTLRLFSVYGPYEESTRFFPAVILSLLQGTSPTLADPGTVRDFVHVDDVVTAFLQAAQRPAGVYNVGTGIETTLRDALALMQAALGSSSALQWGKDPGRGFDTAHWRADTSLAKKDLCWEAQIPLAEGINKTVDWFRAHRDLYA